MKYQKEEAVAHKLADREKVETTPVDILHRKIKLENDIKAAKIQLEAKEEIERNAQKLQVLNKCVSQ